MKQDQEIRKPGDVFPWRCVYCHRPVGLTVLSAWEDDDEDGPWRYTTAKCEECQVPYVLVQGIVQAGPHWEWDAPTQQYPAQRHFDWSIPSGIRNALAEADANFTDQRWSSAGVQARRAVEMLCDDKGAPSQDANGRYQSLKNKLQWLRDNNHIDSSVYGWSDAVRNIGNDAAHDEVDREDARDAIDFAISLCDLLYVVPKRLERHQLRRA